MTEAKEKGKDVEKLFNKIIAEIFLDLGKCMDIRVQEPIGPQIVMTGRDPHHGLV